MKRSRILVLLIAIILVMCTAVPVVGTEAVGDTFRNGKVLYVEGDARVIRGDLEMPVYESMVIQHGDQIVTGEESRVDLQLDEDKYVIVEQNTEVTFELEGSPEKGAIRMYLEKGFVYNDIENPLQEADSYEIHTAEGVMAVRGTTVGVGYADQDAVDDDSADDNSVDNNAADDNAENDNAAGDEQDEEYVMYIILYDGTVTGQRKDEDGNPTGEEQELQAGQTMFMGDGVEGTDGESATPGMQIVDSTEAQDLTDRLRGIDEFSSNIATDGSYDYRIVVGGRDAGEYQPIGGVHIVRVERRLRAEDGQENSASWEEYTEGTLTFSDANDVTVDGMQIRADKIGASVKVTFSVDGKEILSVILKFRNAAEDDEEETIEDTNESQSGSGNVNYNYSSGGNQNTNTNTDTNTKPKKKYKCKNCSETVNKKNAHKADCGTKKHYTCDDMDHEKAGCKNKEHYLCDGENHQKADCGIKKHYLCDGKDHQKADCGIDGHFRCDKEHTACVNCNSYLCLEMSHNLNCGITEVPHYSCDTLTHTVMACGNHYACQVSSGEEHEQLQECGVHYLCQAGEEHGNMYPCEEHWMCNTDYESHESMPCGHGVCVQGEPHTQQCEICESYLCWFDGVNYIHEISSCGYCGISICTETGGHGLCTYCSQPQCSTEGSHDTCYLCSQPMCTTPEIHGVICSFCGESIFCMTAEGAAHQDGICTTDQTEETPLT